MIARGRGAICKPRRAGPIPTMNRGLCWYCGSGRWAGELITQPDGTLLHEGCQEPAARDYPDRQVCDSEQTDNKVAWLDVRGAEDDAKAYWALNDRHGRH